MTAASTGVPEVAEAITTAIHLWMHPFVDARLPTPPRLGYPYRSRPPRHVPHRPPTQNPKERSMTRYLMWFARFGSTHLEEQNTLEDCYELDIMLDEASSATFDEYGILCAVEELTDDGARVIPDDEWDAGVEAHKAQLQAEYERTRAETPPRKPYATVYVFPPFELGHPSRHVAGWEYVGTAYSPEDLDRYRSEWAALGEDRFRFTMCRGESL